MKKLIILAGMLFITSLATFAEQRGVHMEFHRKGDLVNHSDVNRMPIHLPIDVYYDTDSHRIVVIGDESIDAEVFLYNENNTLEGYSSTLNTDFTILTSGSYIIQIYGDGWYAEGRI